jgi:hypothetical protein
MVNVDFGVFCLWKFSLRVAGGVDYEVKTDQTKKPNKNRRAETAWQQPHLPTRHLPLKAKM